MQLRRAVPLSLLALLASAGCVSVGPGSPAPARGSAPLVGAPDASDTPDAPDTAESPGTAALPALSVPRPLPLGDLPGQESGPEPEPDRKRPPAEAARPPAKRPAKPAPPHRAHPPKPASPRFPERLPRVDELCAAAEGTVPASIVDLCVGQYGQPAR
ncbi:hypothetical protein [Streptomyces sp. NPDC012746]|uniref:hypothetical protein n=1 Tax=Streptomyces sp. NPDC012746 TaxID=3364845 RepID=UPI0036CBE6F6